MNFHILTLFPEMVMDGLSTSIIGRAMSKELLTIEAARTRKKEYIYQAAMLDPHTAAELNIEDIVNMVDELIDAHGDYMAMYK
jgi:alpha-galactosidase